MYSWQFGSCGKASASEGVNELDDSGTDGDDEERGEQAEHEGEHELDADLCRAFLGALPTLGARHLGVRAQRLRDAGAETIGLYEHGNECAHVVDLGARGEILHRFDSRLAGARL